MKHLVVFIIFLILVVCCLRDLHMFSTTKSGVPFEYFKTITSEVTPEILANYLNRTNINYSVYKIPNYVHEFMFFDKRFSYVYKSGDKYTILIFKPQKYVKSNSSAYSVFYAKLRELVNTEYSDCFNIIVQSELQEQLLLDASSDIGYKDLVEYCGSFCLIDPVNDTMFVFKKISNTEAEALEVLLQQYYFMRK